jgi:DNA (cytosine-5)-methyltransferase 1
MTAYYNEIDPYAADWLRNLIKEGLIAYGEVDTRSIVDVRSSDLVAFEQCHFFAGLGGWSGALRLAGVSDVEPLWTGSCPCQPFSLAGKQKGFDDERHLWPIWSELIRVRRPAKVFGEQVASASAWLGLVRGDLEAMGYAVGAIPVEAASAGADHLRDRYWFVADGQSFDRRRGPEHSEPAELWISKLGHASDMGNAEHSGRQGRQQVGHGTDSAMSPSQAGLADAHGAAIRIEPGRGSGPSGAGAREYCDDSEGCVADGQTQRRSIWDAGSFSRADVGQRPTQQFERRCGDAEQSLQWVIGADGKARRVGPDLRRLVDGLSEFLAGLRPECYTEAQGQMRDYGQASATRPAEVLRAVWERVLARPAAYEALGEPAGVRGAEILLPFLCELCKRSAEKTDCALPSSQELDDAMRGLRAGGKFARPSLRWGYPEQRAVEHSDPLHALSWLLAQHARSAWSAHRRQNAKALRLLEHNVPARVAKLRALGNAIDLRPAAAFIQAAIGAT